MVLLGSIEGLYGKSLGNNINSFFRMSVMEFGTRTPSCLYYFSMCSFGLILLSISDIIGNRGEKRKVSISDIVGNRGDKRKDQQKSQIIDLRVLIP